MSLPSTTSVRSAIPLTRPYFDEQESRAAADAVTRQLMVGDGPLCHEAEALMESRFQVRHALLTPSCTHAMELSLMALGLKAGDEVILPSFTFSSTANAVLRQGARPVFADIDPVTWNIDPTEVERLITPRTRAFMPIHYAGQGFQLERLRALAERSGCGIIEDAAQCAGARYGGEFLGTYGLAGCFSFHVTKNLTCGEGGALLTDDDNLARTAEIMREKGTNRSMFLRGEVDKYTWVDIGSSFVLSDLAAAILRVQLGKLDEITTKRQKIWNYYAEALAPLEEKGYVTLPKILPPAEPNYHIFGLLTHAISQSDLLARLKALKIGAAFHYIPLHSSPFGRSIVDGAPRDLPVTDLVSSSLVRLPIYPDLSREDQQYIAEAVIAAYGAS